MTPLLTGKRGFKLIIALILIFILSYPSQSKIKQIEIIAFSLRAGGVSSIHFSSVSRFEGSVDCGEFTRGYGFGYLTSVAVERRVNDDFTIGIGASLIDRSGDFTIDSKLPIRFVEAETPENIKIENRLSVNLSYFEADIEVKYKVPEYYLPLPIETFGALRFAVPIERTFTQKDVIISPAAAVFKTTNGKEREIASGKIQSINNFLLGLTIGAEHRIKFNKNFSFTQRLSFDYYLNDVASDVDWNIFGIKLELCLRYGLFESIILPSPLEPSDKNGLNNR